MAKLPPIPRLVREDFPSDLSWIDKLLTPLNSSLSSIYGALGGGLTLTDNLQAQVKTLDIANVSSGGLYVIAQNPSQTIPYNSWTVLNASNVLKDTAGMVTTGAAWKATIPAGEGGTYWVGADAALDLGGTGVGYDILLSVYKNGSEARRLARASATTAVGGLANVGGSCLIDLAAGDYLQVLMLQLNGGAGGRNLEASAIENFINIERRS